LPICVPDLGPIWDKTCRHHALILTSIAGLWTGLVNYATPLLFSISFYEDPLNVSLHPSRSCPTECPEWLSL